MPLAVWPDGGGEVLRIAIWWAHATAATVWIGGSFFYLVVFRPTVRATGAAPELERDLAARFGEVVEASAVVLLVSGAVLAVQRLASSAAGGAYAAVLGVKVLLALALFAFAWELRRPGAGALPGGGRPARSRRMAARLTLVFGIIVVLLAVVLGRLYEAGLTG
jgi:uncharacterized membrane protein